MFKIKYIIWFVEFICWCIIDFFNYKNKKELIKDKWEEYNFRIELDKDEYFQQRLKQIKNDERYK